MYHFFPCWHSVPGDRVMTNDRLQGWYYVKNVSRHQHDKNRYSRIATVDSCFALLGAPQHCVAKICNASQIANLHKLQNDLFTISSSILWTHLRPETSPKKGETAVHCCDPAISVLVMLVSRNVFHVVSALQSIVCYYIFLADQIFYRSYVGSAYR